MTPRELYREIRFAQWRQQHEAEEVVVQAWQTAALVNAALQGKLPKLDVLLSKMRPAEPAKKLSLKDISRTLGLPMRPATPEAIAAMNRLVRRG